MPLGKPAVICTTGGGGEIGITVNEELYAKDYTGQIVHLGSAKKDDLKALRYALDRLEIHCT